MEDKDKLIEEIKTLKEKQLRDKLSRFNELAKELQLSKEELESYPRHTSEELEASITNLRILKGRINQMKDITGNPNYKGNPNSPFFGLKPPPPKEGDEDKPHEILKFNTMQIFDRMRAPSTESEKYDDTCTVIRYYDSPKDTLGRKL